MDGLFYFLMYLRVCVHWKVEYFVCLIADRLTACTELNVSHECQVPEFDTRTMKIRHFPGVVPPRGLGCVSAAAPCKTLFDLRMTSDLSKEGLLFTHDPDLMLGAHKQHGEP